MDRSKEPKRKVIVEIKDFIIVVELNCLGKNMTTNGKIEDMEEG